MLTVEIQNQKCLQKSEREYADTKENTDPRKEHFRRWKHLHSNIKIVAKNSFVIHTKLIPVPRVLEIEERTFTDDPMQLINL